MPTPAIISVAITGSLPQKANNPAVPITPEEQIESTHAAFEAGAALVHIHVRDDEGRPSSDPERFARVQEGVRRHCPGMIVQFSTGGRGRSLSERGSMLHLRPDMASLATGSVNFPTSVYENPPEFVEDLARSIGEMGLLRPITVYRGQILDGRCRALAFARHPHLAPASAWREQEFTGSDADALVYVESMNLRRASYTADQHAEILRKARALKVQDGSRA